ncbi:MAG: Fe-S-containing protein [Candidatus Binataceae bacterium]
MRGTSKIVGVCGAILLAGVAGLAIQGARSACRPVSGASSVSVNVANLPNGDAQSYCYTDRAGQRLRFILARGSDGIVRSVFDACRQCFTFHRGFKISHGELICRVCGNHYPMAHMTEGKASCIPASLPHQGAGAKVTIRTSDLESGRYLF